jgi:hypothetical protein
MKIDQQNAWNFDGCGINFKGNRVLTLVNEKRDSSVFTNTCERIVLYLNGFSVNPNTEVDNVKQ